MQCGVEGRILRGRIMRQGYLQPPPSLLLERSTSTGRYCFSQIVRIQR